MEVLTRKDIVLDYRNQDEFFIHKDRITFAKIKPDDSPENPCDNDDYQGKILSFSSRHANFIGYNKEAEVRRLLKDTDNVKLGYFEHGNCAWFPSEKPPAGVEFQWDGVRFAGIWVAPKAHRDEARRKKLRKNTPERRAYMLEMCKHACNTFTDWCNGEVYGYVTTTYAVLRDEHGEVIEEEDHYYKHAEPVDDESCWGYYGDDVYQAAMNVVADHLDLPKDDLAA